MSGTCLKSLVAALVLCSFGACASSGLAWRRPDGSVDEKELRADVDVCEEHAKLVLGRRPPPSTAGARPYGGWGNLDFEHCMTSRNWVLKPVSPKPRAAERPAG